MNLFYFSSLKIKYKKLGDEKEREKFSCIRFFTHGIWVVSYKDLSFGRIKNSYVAHYIFSDAANNLCGLPGDPECNFCIIYYI